MKKRIILSLGGSIILTKEGRPDVNFLKNFKELIKTRIEEGEQFIIVTGGGSLARIFNEEVKKINQVSPESLDWLGIAVTRVNAAVISSMFEGLVYGKVLTDPRKKIVTQKPIILSGGWKPGWSTDYDSVLLAKVHGAKLVINLSNIDYVYDKDPRKFPEAKPIEKISWGRFRREIVGEKWQPGMNAPFDPIASKLAEKSRIKVAVLKGTGLLNLANFLSDKPFKGTIIE